MKRIFTDNLETLIFFFTMIIVFCILLIGLMIAKGENNYMNFEIETVIITSATAIIVAVVSMIVTIITTNKKLSKESDKKFRDIEKEMSRLIAEYNTSQHKELSKEHNDINSNIDNKYSLLSSMEIKIQGKIENLEQRTNDFYSLTKVSDRQALSTLETSITSLNAENNLLLKMKNELNAEIKNIESINEQMQNILHENNIKIEIDNNIVNVITRDEYER